MAAVLTRHGVAVKVVSDGLLQLVVGRGLLEALAQVVLQVLVQFASCRFGAERQESERGHAVSENCLRTSQVDFTISNRDTAQSDFLQGRKEKHNKGGVKVVGCSTPRA